MADKTERKREINPQNPDYKDVDTLIECVTSKDTFFHITRTLVAQYNGAHYLYEQTGNEEKREEANLYLRNFKKLWLRYQVYHVAYTLKYGPKDFAEKALLLIK